MERMNSVSANCNQLKHRYDDCFNQWFSERFLKGDTKDVCAPLLADYRECVKKSLAELKIDLSEAERDIIGTPHDKSKSHPGGKKAPSS